MPKALTTCGFCSCGCALYIEPRNGQVEGLCPSLNHPVSTGRLCIKGWNATADITGADRLTTPLVRKGSLLQPSSWEEAIEVVASSLKEIQAKFGPQSLGIIGSAKITNEECYSLVKFARSVMGTPNIDGSSRFYDASLVHALLETTGIPSSQIDLNSLLQAGSMLIVGSNLRDQLAHIGSRVEKAARNGCKIVAADPRISSLSLHADLFLQPYPGTDLLWLRALLKEIIDRRLYFPQATDLPGFVELKSSLSDVGASELKEVCGVDMSVIAKASEQLAKSPPVVVMFGLGVLQQMNSSELVKALADVAILLGGVIMPLRGQNNVQGASDLGMAHDLLPGYGLLSDAASRKAWEEAWGCELPSRPGMSAVEMIRGCESGQIKGLLVFGENIVLSAPNTIATLAALHKVGFLVVSDLYLTETAKLARVVFPACSFLEKEGTFTNVERRVQRVRKVLQPVGASRSDLDIMADLTSALGGKISRSPHEVMEEISRNVLQYRDLSHERLDQSWGEQWPLNGQAFRLSPIRGHKVPEDKEYPFRLVASRIHFHQQTGTMSARCRVLAREYPETFAEINRADAERLGLRNGSLVRISSRTGSIMRSLICSDSVRPSCVHVPHYFAGESPNVLAPFEGDPISGVPAYKACPVKVEAGK